MNGEVAPGFVLQDDRRVILEVPADAVQGYKGLYSMTPKMIGWPDAGQHQQLW